MGRTSLRLRDRNHNLDGRLESRMVDVDGDNEFEFNCISRRL